MFYHNIGYSPIYLAFAPVPEPSCIILVAIGALGLVGVRWVKHRA